MLYNTLQKRKPASKQYIAAFIASLDTPYRPRSIENVAFTGAKFPDKTDFSGIIFENVAFDSCTIQGANFTNAYMNNCTFDRALMYRAQFTDAQIYYSTFENVAAWSTSFVRALIRYASFDYADMQFADFTNSSLSTVQFANASLRKAHFDGIQTYEVDMATTRGNGFTTMRPPGYPTALAAGGYISIDYTCASYTYWMQHVDKVGKKAGYPPNIIAVYKAWIECAVAALTDYKGEHNVQHA